MGHLKNGKRLDSGHKAYNFAISETDGRVDFFERVLIFIDFVNSSCGVMLFATVKTGTEKMQLLFH